jgi:hypothetical protein
VEWIFEDPHCIGLAALADHQIKTALINVETVSKWWKGILEDPHFVGLGGLGDFQVKTPLEKKKL